MEFLQAELFETPEWLIDTDIFNKIQFDGYLEKIKSYQERALNNVLDFGRFARMMENEELNDDAYTIVEMMENLRTGLFSELRRGKDISRIRRNLQRAYIARMHELMTEEQSSIPARFRSYVNRSNIDVETSDIRPLVRAELTILQSDMRKAINRTRDTMTRYHLQDAVERIEKIINPEA
jgi:hypothetical protein